MWYLLILAALSLSAVQPVLAQEPLERSGLRPDAPEYGIRGPHWVGYRPIVIREGTDHQLDADLWYPALNPEGATEEITYEFTLKNPDLSSDVPSVVYGHALLDAPIDDTMGPYPLVVFSHGFSANPEWYSTLPEHYASHGFIVLAPEHVEQEWSEVAAASIDRPRDIKQTLDYAEEVTAPGGGLAGQIDMENVAVVGHSFGGYTALAMAGAQYDLDAFNKRFAELPPDDPNAWILMPLVGKEADMAERAGLDPVPEGLWPSFGDPRVTAIVPIAGDAFHFDQAGLSKITIPIMAIGGTADTGAPYDWGTKPSYDYASSARKVLVAFVGAEHMFVSTPCESMPWPTALPFSEVFCLDPVWDKQRALDLIHHFSTAFLLDTLKGDTGAHAALAPEAVSFPGIEYQSKGYATEQADVELVHGWLNHWDTVNGELEGIDEILAGDFVSHNIPEGDREARMAEIAAFRADHPNTFFSVDELVIEDGKAFLIYRMWEMPEDAPEGAEGEPVSPPFLLVLDIEDGKIAERWLYAPLQP
jgi:predicted dienelactone hydrolase